MGEYASHAVDSLWCSHTLHIKNLDFDVRARMIADERECRPKRNEQTHTDTRTQMRQTKGIEADVMEINSAISHSLESRHNYCASHGDALESEEKKKRWP